MTKPSLEPAQISYIDGERKTIVFPEINRGDIKGLKVDGVSCCAGRITKLTKAIQYSIVAMLCLLGFIFHSYSEIQKLKNNAEHYKSTLKKYGVTWDGKDWQHDGNKASGLTVDGVD